LDGQRGLRGQPGAGIKGGKVRARIKTPAHEHGDKARVQLRGERKKKKVGSVSTECIQRGVIHKVAVECRTECRRREASH